MSTQIITAKKLTHMQYRMEKFTINERTYWILEQIQVKPVR